ncbi:DMT family transporter [Paraburkholderia phenazinium]|jgi:drug/metabolite transporter (DMT)-like permease|uniref:Threonine/homoserine efflux transporter RhtA n=1 Tax=Paraburkholderia phenazinium TaxID=60549 RepID=A0A1N6KCW7_9BURK|nr:DMT family transporter [Paraburkholderia phenazinium]SIO54166.1 Threonine/homoserine efflux transporter RhtA [Paraburkholderia phenazinium]
MHDARGGLLILQTIVLTAVAMLAFAANSLLCRLALQRGEIDPVSFAGIRLVSGAIVLAVIVRFRSERPAPGHADWLAAAMLFVYVAFFSFAYLTLSAGTGALILFGAVQLTMFSVGLRSGEKFGSVAWLGLALAVAGLVYLVSPGIAAPPLVGAALMAIAGVAWGVYSLRGRGVADPLAATAGNFARAAPLALLLSVLFIANARVYANGAGVALAIASGALTSGIGYVIWYAALSKLTAMRAATVQLSVPLIAAFGGVAFLSEAITPRLAAASATILGGIAMVLTSKSRT